LVPFIGLQQTLGFSEHVCDL